MNRNRLKFESLEDRCLLAADVLPVVSLAHVERVPLSLPGSNSRLLQGTELDLDGDGMLDWAVVSSNPPTVSFHLMNDEGGYRRVSTARGISGEVISIQQADLNHDGWGDVVVVSDKDTYAIANGGSDEVEWLGMQAPAGLGLATSVSLADVNNDGNVDLIASTSRGVDVRFGGGDGTFEDSVRYVASSGQKQTVYADINGDGWLDLAVANAERKNVTTLLNDGEGFFEASSVSTYHEGVGAVELHDVDGDQRPDLIVGTLNQEEHNVFVQLGRGDGTFAEISQRRETVGAPLDFAVGDLNGDQQLDLVVSHDGTFHHPISNNGPGGISLLMGSDLGFQHSVRVSTPQTARVTIRDEVGSGFGVVSSMLPWANEVLRFQLAPDAFYDSALEYSSAGNSFSFVDPVVGDFNGDGFDDVIRGEGLWGQQGKTIQLWLGSADGFTQDLMIEVDEVEDLFWGDFDNNGVTDFGAVLGGTRQEVISVSYADGTFVTARTRSTSVGEVTVSDVDGDGVLDLVSGRFLSNRLQVMRGVGDGTWTRHSSIQSQGSPWFTQYEDINGDGIRDMVGVLFGGLEVAYGQADGTFGSVIKRTLSDTPARTSGDVNGDGRADLVTHAFDSNQIGILMGSDSTTEPFEKTVSFDVGVRPDVVRLVDIDRDGVAEVLVGAGTDLLIFEWAGDGLSEPELVSLGFSFGDVAVRDLNQDGNLDLLVFQGNLFISTPPSSPLGLLLGRDDGGFEAPVQHVLGAVAAAVVGFVDPDGDGRESVVLATRAGFALLDPPASSIEGDFDADGQLDSHDIDQLCAAVRDLEMDSAELTRFDVTGDRLLNSDDVDHWIRQIANTRPGDFNLDGKVDFGDFLRISANFGQEVEGWSEGDLNCDGEVGFADFLMLADVFGFDRENSAVSPL